MPHSHLPSLTRRRFAAACSGVTAAALLASCGGTGESVTSSSGEVAEHSFKTNYEAMFSTFKPSEEPDGDMSKVVWPAFVTSDSKEVQELYAFHVTSGGLMRYIPCFCGCTGSGHRNNRDCYIKEVHADGSITFDSMAPT